MRGSYECIVNFELISIPNLQRIFSGSHSWREGIRSWGKFHGKDVGICGGRAGEITVKIKASKIKSAVAIERDTRRGPFTSYAWNSSPIRQEHIGRKNIQIGHGGGKQRGEISIENTDPWLDIGRRECRPGYIDITT